MTSHIYHTEGDFVVWFEIHVLPLSLLKKKTQQKQLMKDVCKFHAGRMFIS